MFYTTDLVTGESKQIYSPKEIIKMLEDTFTYFQQNMLNSRTAANKTREEVVAEIHNEFEKENQKLKDKLRFSYGSFYSEKELKAYENFKEEHKKCWENLKNKHEASKQFYIKTYGTGFGISFIACCPWCGEEKDITDIDNW